MSEDEIRAQKGAVLLEHKEALEKLAHLQDKAARIGRCFQEFGKLVEFEPSTKIYDARQVHYDIDVRIIDPKFKETIDYDAVMSLANEIRAAMAEVRQIESRKSRLGV